MSLPKQPKELQRYELYVGVFHNTLWTYESLCDYFHRLINGCHIVECHFYPCANLTLNDHSFAILTFDSISSVDQCLMKRTQIKYEHKLLIKRNLREVSRDQRSVSKHILIHIDKFDQLFNIKTILTYFSQYGLIDQWKMLDNDQTFLLYFQDYDSVDCILLDQPHFFNKQSLLIRKCYNPYTLTLTYSIKNPLKEQIRDLQISIDQLKYSHESQFIKMKNQIQKEIIIEENLHSDILKSYIRLERIQRDLKQDLSDIRQINQQLKKKLQETVKKKDEILDVFQTQLKQQQSINKSLQDTILNFS